MIPRWLLTSSRGGKGAFRRIDFCVTNLGGPPSNCFENIPPEAWPALDQLLMVTTIYFAREALPLMPKNKWARLITIVSPAVKQPADDGLARSLR
jgi:NAD(P)-dependent dehydrogenase (short-subunit alcohol dehydrogenase family)